MNDSEPIPAVSDGGRDMTTGQFTRGNQCSRGNAVVHKAAQFRAKMFRCVSSADFADIIRKLVQAAKSGEPWAVKLACNTLWDVRKTLNFTSDC